MDMEEIWKDVKDFEGFYQVSNLGRVKRLKTRFIRKDGHWFSTPERILNCWFHKGKRHGYLGASIQKYDERRDRDVHSIVAECFLPPKPFEKAEINHIDGNKLNNRADNLEWVSHRENALHATRTNLKYLQHIKGFGKRTMERNRKLTVEQVLEIKKLIGKETDKSIAKKFGVCRENICRIRHGKTWNCLNSTIPPHS